MLRDIIDIYEKLKENLVAIRDILLCFEREYCEKYTHKGTPIIKTEYIEKRLILKHL